MGNDFTKAIATVDEAFIYAKAFSFTILLSLLNPMATQPVFALNSNLTSFLSSQGSNVTR